MEQTCEFFEIEVFGQQIFAAQIDDGAMLGLALVPISFNHAHVFVRRAVTAWGPNDTQEHNTPKPCPCLDARRTRRFASDIPNKNRLNLSPRLRGRRKQNAVKSTLFRRPSPGKRKTRAITASLRSVGAPSMLWSA